MDAASNDVGKIHLHLKTISDTIQLIKEWQDNASQIIKSLHEESEELDYRMADVEDFEASQVVRNSNYEQDLMRFLEDIENITDELANLNHSVEVLESKQVKRVK